MIMKNSTANTVSLLRKAFTPEQLVGLQEVLNEDGEAFYDLLSQVAYRADPLPFVDRYMSYTPEEWAKFGRAGDVPDECLICNAPRADHTEVLALCPLEFPVIEGLNDGSGFVPTDDGNCALCGLYEDHHLGEARSCPPGLGRYRPARGAPCCGLCNLSKDIHEGRELLCPVKTKEG